ncbi:MAG: hypothetical protein HY584_04400 [Candidatus Omnitrophica bacterium]|nr:hypothetical protein [Candidatus Omnitrophota bacterium]
MVIPLLGFANLSLGLAMAFAAYRVVTSGQLENLSQILIPLSHLFVGYGFIRWSGWVRYWAVSLSCFYLVLGILGFTETLLVIDFIPIVPLVEFIPVTLLRWWNPVVGSTLLFFVFPVCIAAYLSVKNVAVTFESWLGGRFSWGAPFLVVLASAFIFTYAMLYASQISFFMDPQPKSIFGFSLAPGHGQILRHVEFYLPLVLALGFTSGGLMPWVLALMFALYYWLPLLFGADHAAGPDHFKFLFFGIGWACVALIALFYSRFFWRPRAWLDKRAVYLPKGGDLIEAKEATGQPQAPARFGNSVTNFFRGRAMPLLVLFGLGAVLLGTALYFWSGERMEKRMKPKPPMESSEPTIKLEGVSIDSQGAYAIINGEVVTVGDRVQGYEVEAIKADRVLISKDGKQYRLDQEGKFESA